MHTTPLQLPETTVKMMGTMGLTPDPWQRDVIYSEHPQILLNCCRQSGKSTLVATIALIEANLRSRMSVVLISRSHRQSRELLRKMARYYRYLAKHQKLRENVEEVEFANESRVLSLPCREDTIRGYSKIDLLIIDEAARVPDDLYRAVRPMLAVSQGRIMCLSTPYGKRGFFWEAWAKGGDDWQRFEVPATECPRITPEFLEQERRALGEMWYRQEYCCSFEALEGLVYPDFAKCVTSEVPPHVTQAIAEASKRTECRGDWFGGIDFGFRNPFAAVWGFLDRDGIFWLTGEHYVRQQGIGYHAARLPRYVYWYADPSGASDCAGLRAEGHLVAPGDNTMRSGIAAVSAGLAAGSLRVVKGCCPNLLAEASLYRYGDSVTQAQGGEAPIAENNHALDALRYAISRLGDRRAGRN